MPLTFNDQPISHPDDDCFGVDPFAKALARSIETMDAPEGFVVAVNGSWGSGKSSVINLVLHHLKQNISRDDIRAVKFSCWWFRGEEALTLSFFRELYGALSPGLAQQAQQLLPELGVRLLRAGPVVGAAIDVLGGAGVGSVVGSSMQWASDFIKQGENVEELHDQLAQALKAQKKKFVVVLDDIDRLSPDEAILIFRLIKSVGRLPSVVYLLAFDRSLAERVVAERYPAEGPHYLDKIVQAVFEVPEVDPDDLYSQFLTNIESICGPIVEKDTVDFLNIFYDCVAPELRTPRDVIRIINTISFTWPSVVGEVYLADFVALETLRVCKPKMYLAIREHGETLCSGEALEMRTSQADRAAEYDQVFLSSVDERERGRYRSALMRLFPPLQSVWINVHFGGDFRSRWLRDRRVCTKEHFDTYFRLTVGDQVVSRAEIERLIERTNDKTFIQTTMREALQTRRKGGATKAATLLDQLNVHANDVPDDRVQSLLEALFEIADELDVDADRTGGFGIGDNFLRLHWLLRRLTLERFQLEERTDMFLQACRQASLGWFVDFSESAYRDYHPKEGHEPEPEEKCLVTAEAAETLHKEALDRIAGAAASGELIASRHLIRLLYVWRGQADDPAEVRKWVDEQMAKSAAVVQLAKALTSYSWTQGIGDLGDRVARRRTRVGVSSLDELLDSSKFRQKIEELAVGDDLAAEDREAVVTFLEAWRRQERGGDDSPW